MPFLKNDSIKWSPIDKKSKGISYLHITNDGLSVGVNPHRKVMEFWTDIEQQAKKLAQDSLEQPKEEL